MNGGRTHVLKTWPAYFEPVLSGAKSFEIRWNDRGYQAGDTLVLAEYDSRTSCGCAQAAIETDTPGAVRHEQGNCARFTGRQVQVVVTYVLSSMPSLGSRANFDGRGYVVLALDMDHLVAGRARQAEPVRTVPQIHAPIIDPLAVKAAIAKAEREGAATSGTATSTPSPADVARRLVGA